MSNTGYRYAQQQSWENTLKFLTWEQFPAILEKSIKFSAVLPQIGVYRHVNTGVKDFGEALQDTVSRTFTLSGVGSLIDYETNGHQIKRPSPQLQGTACNGNSLCLEPQCFGFAEGVIENNNVIQNICWSLSMPCLKDFQYSDMQFPRKMREYFAMFFQQPVAVLQAYQRTRLIKEAIKVVATDINFKFTGSFLQGLSLPFYINPTDATNFPNLTTIAAAGGSVGGFNIPAFMHYVAPRMFSSSFTGGVRTVKVYGLKSDYMVAKEQSATVQDHAMDLKTIQMLLSQGGAMGAFSDRIDSMLGGNFVDDPLFPTFKDDGTGQIVPITAEVLEAATIAGYVQNPNPEHNLADIRGLLFVPDNVMFDLIEPPKDNFSDLGLAALNFAQNTPGAFRIMSSDIFTTNQLGPDGVMTLGQTVDENMNVVPVVRGVEERAEALKQAIRTDLLLTYSQLECGLAGQYPNVGPATHPQGSADGFRLKSTMYIGTDFQGSPKPVLVLFKTDTPRSALPISVCTEVEVEVTDDTGVGIVDCCPGNQIYTVLTFSTGYDASTDFDVADEATYRTGPKGTTYLVDVTAVSGNVVTIESRDDTTILPCCAGPDQYGFLGELLNDTNATATSSEIMKAEYDTGASELLLEFFDPLVANLATTAATITLQDGTVINVVLAADAAGVFASVTPAVGELFDLTTLDCSCLINAVFSY